MSRAVRFDRYGGIEVLEVVDVEPPAPRPGEVVVRVRAAGINPGEVKIRQGVFAERWPATFPSGQGSDLAGVVEAVGPDVTAWAPGDEVIGFTHERKSQAELVAVHAEDLTAKPKGVPWEVAGTLFVAGTTAWAASRSVDPRPGDVIVVSGAGGAVGSLVVQLLAHAGATVIGLASPANHAYVEQLGASPVSYADDGLLDRLRQAAPGGVDALIDTVGGYLDTALELGGEPARIDTIADRDWDRAAAIGAKTDGNWEGARAEVLAELAALVETGALTVRIAAT
jgi:NADPH:quinone reductase-like Zn-dependent oxidoreductase